MISITATIYLIVLSTVILHTLVGCVLVPMRGSLLIDGTGHSVVFGIILGFMISKDLNSAWLFIGAIISALLMNFLINFFNKNKEISYDASIGLSFSLLFSLGILLISVYARNIHLDLDMILLGNVEYAIYDLVKFSTIMTLPRIFYITFFVSMIMVLFLYLFWNKIILLLFDREYAKLKGVKINFMEYFISLFSSCVIVASFNIMGALILVGIATAPFGFVWQKSLNYFNFIINSLIVNFIVAVIATFFSIKYNLPIAATVSLFLTFFSVLNLIIPFYKRIV